MNLTFNAPVQRAARALNDLQTARSEIMAMVSSPRNPIDKQAMLLAHMLARAYDAIKDDFSRITMDLPLKFEVVLKDRKTGELYDPATGVALSDLP